MKSLLICLGLGLAGQPLAFGSETRLGPSQDVQVPSVIDDYCGDAELELNGAGLIMRVVDSLANPDNPHPPSDAERQYKVAEQEPGEYANAPAGSIVSVVLVVPPGTNDPSQPGCPAWPYWVIVVLVIIIIVILFKPKRA